MMERDDPAKEKPVVHAMSSAAFEAGRAMTPDERWSALMAAAQTGDRAAYASLLKECAPFIQRIAARQGVRGDRVDDVVQDVLITLHRVRATYDPARSFSAWLRVIAQRRAIDLLRGRSRLEKREVHAPIAYEAHADPRVDPAAHSERREEAAVLSGAIDSLPPGQREAVKHLALREMSLEEAAAATGRSKGALKVNLHRALKSLRARLSGED